MKNLRYIPFMRNRYYEGKLLTTEDFEQEQRYINDKRRLHNRYFHGAGVVSGLEVIRVDDYSISLEMGVAIDGAGREIVVEAPHIYKLSMIEGFESAAGMEGGESLMLYIAYEEEEVEPVHSRMNRPVHNGEELDYNKIREQYRLYVTDQEPAKLEVFHEEEPQDGLYARAERLERMEGAEGICLARIELVKAGDFYMIENIEPMYGNQYSICTPLLSHRIKQLEDRVKELARQEKKGGLQPEKADNSQSVKGEAGRLEFERECGNGHEPWQLARGSVKIPLGKRGRRGQTAFSQEIAHGLGLGNTDIFLQVLNGDMLYGGSEDIFAEPEAWAACAYRLNRGTGTFVIGIRLLEDTQEREITVNWTALRNRRREEIQPGEKRIYIDPPILNLSVRQKQKLAAVCVNFTGEKLIWSVPGPEYGEIEPDGLYHAPNRPGVYQISVRDEKEPSVSASVFAVVRE